MKLQVNDLKVELFADGADLQGILEMDTKPYIKGFTTNPTLMRKSGVTNYENFARSVLDKIRNKPISFEVFSDDLEEMKKQGLKIASWGANVFVKIPVTNTHKKSTSEVIRYLTENNVKVNVTAIMTPEQVLSVSECLNPKVESYISVFAGRIADTGRDPLPILKKSIEILQKNSNSKLIWASPREFLNVFQANEIGCHVITMTNDLLKKIELLGKNLDEYSLETVQMFRTDAIAARFSL
jgi:transaldolase